MNLNDVLADAGATSIEDLSDPQLVAATSTAVYFRYPHTSELHAEAGRRGKPWLYQQGWNRAYQEAGYVLSDADLAAAQPATTAADRER